MGLEKRVPMLTHPLQVLDTRQPAFKMSSAVWRYGGGTVNENIMSCCAGRARLLPSSLAGSASVLPA